MERFAIIVIDDVGEKSYRSFHKSLKIARRIAADLNACKYLLYSYKVYDLENHCYC